MTTTANFIEYDPIADMVEIWAIVNDSYDLTINIEAKHFEKWLKDARWFEDKPVDVDAWLEETSKEHQKQAAQQFIDSL